MNLRHLRTFVIIADAGGIAHASGKLNLSQPAASRQIATLENDLGVKLFDRIGRRFRLTSEGEYLLRRSRRLLVDADSFTEEAQALKKSQVGLLRVGASPQVIESTLGNFLAHHRHRHPGIEVHLVEDGSVHLADRLVRADVHLALVASDDRFQQQPLFPLYVLAVMSKTHRLSRRGTLDIVELANEPIMLLNRSFATRELFDAACSVARIHPRVLLESTAAHTIVALASENYGIAIVPSSGLISHNGVRAMPLVRHGVAVGSWVMVAWDPLRFLPPYAREFVDELVAHCRRAHPGREFIQYTRLPKPKEQAKPSVK